MINLLSSARALRQATHLAMKTIAMMIFHMAVLLGGGVVACARSCLDSSYQRANLCLRVRAINGLAWNREVTIFFLLRPLQLWHHGRIG